MKVPLIEIRPKHSSYGLFSIAPLGLMYLGTILKNRQYDVTIYDEARTDIYNEKNGNLYKELINSDFIGVSVISPAANRALKLLKTIKSINPEIRTAAGGPHVLGEQQAQEFSTYADVVVQREAENIIEDVVLGKLRGIVKGSTVENLDKLPIPDFNLLHYSKRKILDFFKLTPISTTRGCPRNCEFCTVSNIHGKKVRMRSTDLIMKELRQRLTEGYKPIFFADDNFSVIPSRHKPLLKEMAKEKEKDHWFQSIIVQDEVPGILKGGDEYVIMMKRAGIKTN